MRRGWRENRAGLPKQDYLTVFLQGKLTDAHMIKTNSVKSVIKSH